MSFHPAQFTIVHKDNQRERTSFVGIRRNEGRESAFVLPPGFNDFPVCDAETVSAYFFKLFRVLRTFRKQVEDAQDAPEGDFAGERGIEVRGEDDEPAMLYTKIHMLEEVLERYDKLRIYNILYRNRRTEEVDYSQIHRYLDKAVYQNDIPYVDEMRRPRPVIEMRISTLVRMFCFIYAEIAPRTGHTIDPQVQSEATRFQAEHLAPDSALFGSIDSHTRTIHELKVCLDDIDREVAFKSEDYWYFFTAVEAFLYGELDEDEEGVSWGITRFAPVWEDMCMVWIHKNNWSSVVYADSERYANRWMAGHRIFVHDSFDPPFEVGLNGETRTMRPDLVRRAKASSEDLFAISNPQQMKVRVKVREDKRTDESLRILKRVRKQVERGPAGGVTKDSRAQKWTCVFYGVPKSRVESLIEKAGKREGLMGNAVYKAVDFKCTPHTLYTADRLGEKARMDERKQITYEYALQLSEGAPTRSQLAVPTYFNPSPEEIGLVIGAERLNSRIRDQKIEVLRVDFDKVLDMYIK